MTERLHAYLDDVERQFLLSPVVRSFQVREREVHLQNGFLRIRATLSNDDVLEAFEFVVATPDTIETLTYRIHWQRSDGHLMRRWDNAPPSQRGVHLSASCACGRRHAGRSL